MKKGNIIKLLALMLVVLSVLTACATAGNKPAKGGGGQHSEVETTVVVSE